MLDDWNGYVASDFEQWLVKELDRWTRRFAAEFGTGLGCVKFREAVGYVAGIGERIPWWRLPFR